MMPYPGYTLPHPGFCPTWGTMPMGLPVYPNQPTSMPLPTPAFVRKVSCSTSTAEDISQLAETSKISSSIAAAPSLKELTSHSEPANGNGISVPDPVFKAAITQQAAVNDESTTRNSSSPGIV